MDANDESSKEIIDNIEETINKAQEDSLPKIELPDELKIQEENEDEVSDKEDLIEEVDLNTEEETDNNTSEEIKDELVKDTDKEERPEDNKEDEGSSSIKVEM